MKKLLFLSFLAFLLLLSTSIYAQNASTNTSTNTTCSWTSDETCPSNCVAGTDADCCTQKGYFVLTANLLGVCQQACYSSNYTSGTTPCMECKSTSDNACPNWCSAGSDYDCCINAGKCWTEGTGCDTCTTNQTCPTCQSPSAWSTCANNNQTRTNYKCDSTTSYQCQSYTETQSCTSVDTSAPTVDSASPTSAVPSQSTTFTASVSDNVGVASCEFSLNNNLYLASVSNNIASYTTTLTEGSYPVYFKCKDAAGNIGTGTATTVTVSKQQLSASITLPKKTYYPAESLEPRVTVKDPAGKIIVNATVKGNLTYGTKSSSLSFFYSSLCDCYKAYYWISEGALPNDYILTVTATHSSYQSAAATATFTLIKPTLQMSMSTDKSEYNPGDSIKTTIEVKDSLGNAITNAYMTGTLRDASTGALVSLIYPWWKDSSYYYDYYIGSESVGKSYTIYVNASWKEQYASASTTVSITKKGLNADIVLEKNVLMPGDTIQGKIKVFDKSGNIITDAKVSVELKDSNDKGYRWLSATYKDGFYEIEKWKIEDWISIGTYTLSVKIDRSGETVTLTKTIEITKEKVNVDILFDQTSYAPGDRVYIKILVTYSNGSIVPDAYIGGEIFPLTQEVVNATTSITGSAILISPGAVTATAVVTNIGEPIHHCRIYISPQGPLYYKGEYVQKYYVEDVYIPDYCPTGTYALRLRIGAKGYLETEYSEEFAVVLHKLFLETGFKVGSSPGSVDLGIYAEVKDEFGKVVPNTNIKGYLHPLDEKTFGCIKQVYLGYNELAKRYSGSVFLGKNECPEGKYLLEITASQPSYETATVTQGVEIKYSEGYEYNVVVPPSIGTPMCREVSCGPDCVNKICETPTPLEQCYEKVTDKECIKDCSNKATAIEQSISKGEETKEFDVKSCIENCAKKVACRGSAGSSTESQAMLNKLEEISAEIKKTGEQVNLAVRLLRAIIDFFNSIVRVFGGGLTSETRIQQIAPMNETGT